MIREIKGYFWGNGDLPVKRDDHAMDELRYYIMSRPESAEREVVKLNEIQMHKEKLISRVRRQNLNKRRGL